MKKTEQIIAVEDFLSVKGVSLESFYAIRICDDRIFLQGRFDSHIILATRESFLWGFEGNGYVETKIEVPAEDQVLIPVTITLC